MFDLADIPGGIGKFKPDAPALPAGWKEPTLDYRDFVPHVDVPRVVGDGVDAGLRDYLSWPEFLRHDWPPQETNRQSLKRTSTKRRSREWVPRTASGAAADL